MPQVPRGWLLPRDGMTLVAMGTVATDPPKSQQPNQVPGSVAPTRLQADNHITRHSGCWKVSTWHQIGDRLLAEALGLLTSQQGLPWTSGPSVDPGTPGPSPGSDPAHLGNVPTHLLPFSFFFFFLIDLFMRDTERGAETQAQAEGEAGSTQGSRRGTRSGVSRITPWTEGGVKPLGHRGCPTSTFPSVKHEKSHLSHPSDRPG